MLSLQDLLSLWGFESHPFETYTAEQEPRLAEYFVPPPYLDDVIGSPTSPTPAVIFGARGLGKSAIRLFLETKCSNQPELQAVAVTYDSFDSVLSDGLKGVTLARHLRAILERMVCAALVRIASAHVDANGEAKPTEKSLRDPFPSLDVVLFSRLVGRHFAHLPEVQRQKAFRSVSDYFRSKSLSTLDRLTFFQRAWSTLRAPLFDLVNVIQAVRGKEGISPTTISDIEAKAVTDPAQLLADLELMAGLAPQLGFSGWYVLIDKIDETAATDSDASKAASLVLPLLKSLSLLEVPGVGLKFFLWDQIRPMLVEENVRLDKIRNWRMDWTDSELRGMIDARLRVFSGGRVASLSALLEQDVDLYAIAIEHAMSSPREMAQVLDAIFREHARRSDQDNGATITTASIDRGLDEYCRRRVSDLYPADTVNSICRLPGSTFTSAVVQSIFRISQQAASNKIGGWVSNGLVERTDDIRSEKGSFIHQYRIRERRLRRMVEHQLEASS